MPAGLGMTSVGICAGLGPAQNPGFRPTRLPLLPLGIAQRATRFPWDSQELLPWFPWALSAPPACPISIPSTSALMMLETIFASLNHFIFFNSLYFPPALPQQTLLSHQHFSCLAIQFPRVWKIQCYSWLEVKLFILEY